MFTVFFARWFLKEPILKTDLINIGLVFGGIILIVKPPFIFGWTDMYTSDPHAKACMKSYFLSPYFCENVFDCTLSLQWAVLGTILSCVFVQSNVLVVLRFLKGNYHYVNKV